MADDPNNTQSENVIELHSMTDDDDTDGYKTKDPLAPNDENDGIKLKREAKGNREAEMKQAYANPFKLENMAKNEQKAA